MAVSVSYPGVYVQEISSGVRTIVGVGTSIGMFIGRASGGELYKPVQCLSFEDVARNFTTEDGGSELIPSLRMFFTNGGSNCYVMRIADDAAAPAKLSLLSEAKIIASPALVVSALGAGLMGNDIRLSVSYNTAQPESTFNLEVFRWQKQSNGTQTRASIESHTGLSMNPNHPRYVEDIVNRDSSLISVDDPALLAVGASGYSQSGYAISATDDPTLQAQVAALLGKGTRFGLSVDGAAAAAIDLTAQIAVFGGAAMTQAQMETALTGAINGFLPANLQIAATFAAGPAGTAAQPNASTKLLTITRVGGDVNINAAAAKDLAVLLMLGTAQGGIEVSPFSTRRPAASGIVSTLANAISFGALAQDAINVLEINGIEVYLNGANALTTTTAAGITSPKMFQDRSATDYHDGRGGLREKFAIIAAAIVAQRAADPSFEWTAEVWGSRLALIPAGSAADATTAVVRAGKRPVLPPPLPLPALPVVAGVLNSTSTLQPNVRYYALGATPAGSYYVAGVSGNPGGAPGLQHYDKAYQLIDKEVDLFNIMVLPPDHDHAEATQRKLWGPASVFCQQRRAFLLIDPPASWTTSQKATDATVGVNSLRIGLVKDHSAVMYPPLKIDLGGKEVFVAPSGAIAGLFSRIDSTRGVWKAPAGTEADLRGVIGVKYKFSDGENGVLNPKAVNTIRVFPNGIVSWGARTMDGDDGFGSEYKYIPIRRLALFMEESLYRGLKWAVFEPNDEPLWSQIRLNVGAFMHNLFRQGAFQGQTPRDAYFVKCDSSTTTQNDRNLGIVNVIVGFAPLKPAEFVVLSLQQMAGQIET
jgi:phage tail sheath protein FI